MKAIHMLAVGLILLATGAQATDFTLKKGVSGLFDWTDGNNYVGDEAPQQKDLSATDRDAVIVPDNVTVVISNVMPNASLALINSLARIRPNGSRTRIVFAVEDGETLTLDCAVNYEGESSLCRGTLVKDGAGELYLSAEVNRYRYGNNNNYHNAFYVNLEVNAGKLKFRQDNIKPDQCFNFGQVFLAEGATWLPPTPTSSSASSSVHVLGLRGAGTIDTEVTGVYRYINAAGGTSAQPLEFSGDSKLISISFLPKAYYNLTGTNSTGTGTFDIEGNHCVDGGRIGVRKFGKKGQPSSIGMQSNVNLASRDGFWLTSLRQTEDPIDECDKSICLFSGSGTGTAVLDGGALGGFNYVGAITEHSTNPGQKRLMLTGSNVTECVLGATFKRYESPAYPTGGYSVYLIKRGTGAWRLTDSNSALSGVIAVEEGTLRYDSIANSGTASALGTARDLYCSKDAHGTPLTEDDQVGYAFLLGDGTAEHEGNLEYVGTESTICSTRPLALNGKGRLTNASAKGFTFSDVYTVGTGDNVLTLDGDDTSAANVLTGVNDQKDGNGAPLSIVKDGAGTWKLTGDLSLRGSISVKKGTLLINNNYTWYKWIIKSTKYELAPAANTIQLVCGDFGLYAADGSRQNLNLTYQRLAYPNLAPGYIDYGFTAADKFDPQNVAASYPRDLDLLCDGSIATKISFWYKTAPDTEYAGTARNVPHDHPEQETTWLPIVMRLSDDALPVTRYDYATTANANTQVYRTKLYASADGLEWEEMEDGDKVVSPTGMWELAGRTVVNGEDAIHTNALGEVDGQEIPAIPARYRSGYLTDVASYAVAPGATLKIRGNAAIGGLTVDPSGAGTIDGGTFAANGSIDVTGMAKDVKAMTVKFNLVDTSGFGNVANWTLKENGVPTAKLSASVNEDGTITIRRAGLLLLVR